jgi:hypothetical protein
MMRPVWIALSLLASCAGVSHRLDARVAAPHSIAVLPVEGAASLAERELARGLLVARLREHGFVVVESLHVDRVLSETGRMTDPDAFGADLGAIAAIATSIGVDAVLHVASFDESNWNAIALRRHAISASLQIVTKDGAEWWSARHSVGEFGGFALKSGQVITELLAQGAHGTSAASLGKIDTLVEDVAAVLPTDSDRAEHAEVAAAPPAREGRVESAAAASGRVRTVVEVRCEEGLLLVVDIGPLQGVPMAGAGGIYRAAVELPQGEARVIVRSRNGQGGEASSTIGGAQ